jgi:L-amino acid N-acyltransferase YncA
MRILAAAPEHLPGIAAIYDPECLHGFATFMTEPRTPAQWGQWLGEHTDPGHPALVAVEESTSGGEKSLSVIGFASLSAWSPRQAYARTAENSVYVHPAARGRGVGKALMIELMERAKAAGVCVVIARVTEVNPASVKFHESLGFATIGVQRRAGVKLGRMIDVRIMDKHLDR